jgi:hypothetical protein
MKDGPIDDLGASNEHMDPKIRIYTKNRVGKCFFQRKSMIKMASHYRATIVNRKLMTVGDDHERQSMIMVIVNNEVAVNSADMIMIMWQDANVETRS